MQENLNAMQESLYGIEEGDISHEFDAKEIKQACEHNLDLWAGILAPEECLSPFADFHNALFSLLTEACKKPKHDQKFAIGVPRGMAKTHFIKLLIAHLVTFTHHRFILTIGNTATLAQNVIGDATSLLDSPNYVSLFGSWRHGCETDNKEEKTFTFRGKQNIIKALGCGGSVRGINKNNARPSIIIMDDMQDYENSQNPILSKALYKWMRGTLIPAGSPHGCIVIYIGNMYPRVDDENKQPCCILHKLKLDRNWTSLIAGALIYNKDNELESLWEDVHPKQKLLQKLQEETDAGTPEIFFSEYMNDPECKSLSLSFKLEDIQVNPYREEFDLGQFLIIDVATDKKTSDEVVISRFSRQMDKHLLVECRHGKFSPSEIITEALEMATTNGCSLIAVESVNFQYALLHFFQKAAQSLQIEGIMFVEVHPKGLSKNQRIKVMFSQLAKGEIHLSPDIANLVKNQIMQFNPLKTNNQDDILDTLAYVTQVESLYGPLIHRLIDMRQEQGSLPIDYEDCLSF